MHNLLPGLRKFRERVFPSQQELFAALSHGQNPHTLMITCSDSRIDPNLVTQTQPGELFVVRNAGNIVPPYGASRGGEEAAIEFAIEALGVSNIVVCGHSQCGAMSALAQQRDMEHMPSVKRWLAHAAATRRRIELMEQSECQVHRFVEENVLVQVDNLKTHPSVSAALRLGRIRIFAWIYNFEFGSVEVYDPTARRYLSSSEVRDGVEQDESRFAL
ncbi:MAG: carbonic anhydrase [Proteobacteria bacterium]|nr:carbonic anhydrase [Pseudomonadota bacterium]